MAPVVGGAFLHAVAKAASSQERAEQSFRDDGEESMLGRRQWQNALHLHRTWPWCGRAPTIAHGNPVD
jgi:hypothetical protein